MAVGNINELPENILLELFTHIPARQLLLHCRPVCSLWRDLIDLVTLWKRKCLREGFITEDWDQPVADWKIFYFLRSLQRNLLHNPCAEEGFEFWSLDVNGGDEWKVEDLSKDQRKEFPNEQVKKYFVTSYYTCLKSQVVDLKAEGYWEELMDTTRPDIEVKDWFAARPDCGSKYQLCVQLLSSAHAPLGTFQPDPVTIQQKSDAKWREVSHTFSNYPPGVRYIWFQHGGVDTHYWAGWYGPRVTNSSIIIGALRAGTGRAPQRTHGMPRIESSTHMVNINELPENILLELFTHVPARHLVAKCRLVCSLWRDLIDVVTLWKCKSLREGFITKDWNEPVEDWKTFYFLCSLQRNLLRNPCAEEESQWTEKMRSWRIDSNDGDKWKVERLPGAHGTNFPDPKVKKYFVTSYGMCLKSQMVNLKAEGYWDKLMDNFRPDIVVKDWFAPRADCGCTYHLRVQLVSADYIVLASFEPPPVTIEQWNDAAWREVSHTFSDYPPGVRYILFQHGGQDTQFWKGWYGPRVTNSSIIISHRTAKNPAPARALPEDTVSARRRRRLASKALKRDLFCR
ncbi:F-box only protein 44 isoform X1 [Sigmodon hispidus]